MKYLTIKQLQEKLGGRSRSAIYEDIAEGRLPKPIKLGGRSLIGDEEVDKLLMSSRDREDNK